MAQPRTRGDWLWLVAIGLVAGFLSGLFGVGGGVLLVPALMALLRFDIRRAAGTSLAAIVPTTIVGVIAYVLTDAVDWIAAALLAAGAIVGAQLGSHLLSRLPKTALRWGFIVFIAVVIGSLFLVIPSREATIELTAGVIVGIIALGLFTGILSGLLGIGGGAVVVPMLILLFGASDLVAKGTSLAMMIPTALSGTFANVRRRNVDLSAAIVIGVSAGVTTAFGALAAAAVPPFVGNVLFAAFLAFIAVRMIVETIGRRR